jgi:hypothetical protein
MISLIKMVLNKKYLNVSANLINTATSKYYDL